MRIVIAEDSVLLRQGLVHLLTDAGMEVVAACVSNLDTRWTESSHLEGVPVFGFLSSDAKNGAVAGGLFR